MQKQNAVIVKVLDDLLEHAKDHKNTHGKVLESYDAGDGLLKAYHQALDTVIYLKKALMERHPACKENVVHLFPPQYPAA
jgi:hypothetical protein